MELTRVKLANFPCWDILRVESDEMLPISGDEVRIGDQTWYRVALPDGLFVVPDKKQQWEVNLSLKVEMSR